MSKAHDVTEKPTSATVALHVFVVENHDDTREVVAAMLEELGHRVSMANAVTVALREVPASNCDVLISDIDLPDGNGWELLRTLSESRAIFAIAMSGFGTASDRACSKAAGFRHHLVKPIGLQQLETVLAEAANELHGSTEREAVVLRHGLAPT